MKTKLQHFSKPFTGAMLLGVFFVWAVGLFAQLPVPPEMDVPSNSTSIPSGTGAFDSGRLATGLNNPKYLEPLPAIEITATAGTPEGEYSTLKEAFDMINLGMHNGYIQIKIIESLVETETCVLNASGSGNAVYDSVLIYPSVPALSITGDMELPLIDLNGADNVTIDGRVNATGDVKDLVISNTNASTTLGTSTIRFINDASANTVKYCTLKGSSTAARGGVLIFFTTTGTTGNDDNTIEHNDITNAGGNRPKYTLYSVGTTGAGFENSGNTVSNNNIFDFLGCTGSGSSAAIYLSTCNTAWTISDNSFYETTSLAPTSDLAYYAVYISNTGSNYTISNNYIGGSAPLCGGTPWTKTNTANNEFLAIYASTGTGMASNIQGNTIKNFNYANNGSNGWRGIPIAGAGDVNVGTTTGNIIGSPTGIESIVYTSVSGGVRGINVNHCTGTIDIRHNSIGAVKTGDEASTARNDLSCIFGNMTSGTLIIMDNTIGSATTANSINASSTGTSSGQALWGINIATGTATCTVTGNLIANMNNATTYAGGDQTRGIYLWNGTAGVTTIANNTVRNITTANNPTATTAALEGIRFYNTGSTVHTISGNSVYNLSNSRAELAGIVRGIYVNVSTTESIIERNFVYDLSVASASAKIEGLYIYGGSVKCSNNIISLGNGLALGSEINGIRLNASTSSTMKFYHNTVYLGGTVTGVTANTYALRNAVVTTRDFRNNVFNNSRSGGTTGKHYAASITTTTNLTNCDYNNYYAPNGVIGLLLTTDKTTLADWQTATGQDLHSINTDPVFAVNPPDTTATDYTPTVTLTGSTIAGQDVDYDSTTRLDPPTMGAFEKGSAHKLLVTPLAGFGEVCIHTVSDTNSFTISGTDLSADNITVGALAGFTYATTLPGPYADSLNLTQPGGSYSQKILVKFSPTAVQSYNGNIPVGGGGAAAKNVAATGSGIVCAPATQASDITFAAVEQNSMTLGWTRGNGDSCAVFVARADTGAAVPVDDTYYAADSVFQSGDPIGTSGWYAVYRGADTTVTITGLNENTTYRAHVCEFNSGSTLYNADTSATNPANGTTLGLFPEIDVRGNLVSIANGDTLPSLTDHTDFDSANVSIGSVERTFTVRNTGNAILLLGPRKADNENGSLVFAKPPNVVVIGGTHASDYTLTQDVPPNIAAGDSAKFKVKFDPSATGLRKATITLINSDADENPYTFAIQGTGSMLPPEIDVRGNLVSIANGDTLPSLTDWTDFDSVSVADDSLEQKFTIHNTGATTLYLGGSVQHIMADPRPQNAVTITGDHAADFEVTQQPAATVAAGDSTPFKIKFNPSAAGLRSATVSISNDDADENPYNFAIQGTGLTTPTVTTTPVSAVATTTASAGGNVTDAGGSMISARGLCWGSAKNPTTDSSHTSDGTGTGVFTSSLTGLTPNTSYHLRAYATNSTGTGYGADTSFCTLSVPPTAKTITCDTSGTTTLTFTPVGGFGAGKVEYYRHVLADSAAHTWTANETRWDANALKLGIPTASKNYYFHVQGFNADSLPNGNLALGPFLWDGTPISSVTSLDVNANRNSLSFSWTNPVNDAHSVEVWLKGFGGYPHFSGSTPDFPSTPTEAFENGWFKAADSLSTSLNYTPANRDFYYTAVFVEDFAEHYSAAVIDSSLSCWLGDVNPTPDGEVNAADIAILASAYRTKFGENYFNPACDVGPTLNRRRTGRPVPDSSINFEDLMIFAMNYESTGQKNAEKVLAKTTSQPITLNLNIQQVNGQFFAQIQVIGNQDFVKGLEIPVNFGADLQVISVKKGDMVTDGDFFQYDQTENTFLISTAALNAPGVFEGDGVVAGIEFQANGPDASVQFGEVVARTALNETIEVNYEYTDVELIAGSLIPTEYKLHQNFPNPFNPRTTIRYDLKENGPVKITLYNNNGQLVATLLDETKNAGYHSFVFEAGHLPSGMYFYKIQMNDFSDIRKLVLIK